MGLGDHPRLGRISSALDSNQRLTRDDGLLLMQDPDLPSVLALGEASKRARYGSDVFFNSNLHINQTNIRNSYTSIGANSIRTIDIPYIG